MSAPNTHTTVGETEAPPPPKISKTNHFDNGHETVMEFRRTYQHYITNQGSVPGQITRANFYTAGSLNNVNASENQCGLHPIPYYNLGAAHTPGTWTMMQTRGNAFQVLEMGYKIKRMQILMEKVVYAAGTASVDNIYDSNPCFMIYSDVDHVYQEYMGKGNQATQALAGTRCGDYTKAFLPCFSDNNYYRKVPLDNAEKMMRAFPLSQLDGTMREASFYFPIQSSTVAAANQVVFQPTDHMPCELLSSGDTHEHTWVNPDPVWHLNGSMLCQPLKDGTNMGYWPLTRRAALITSYPGPIVGFKGDIGNGLVDYQSVNTHIQAAPDMKFIALQVQWGPESYMNITACLFIEYYLKIKMKLLNINSDMLIPFGTLNFGYGDNSAGMTWNAMINKHTKGAFAASNAPFMAEMAPEFAL